MRRTLSRFLFLFLMPLISMPHTQAQVLQEKHKHFIKKAAILARNGVSREKVIHFFEQELLTSTNNSSPVHIEQEGDKKFKPLLVVGLCCLLALGGVIYFYVKTKNPPQNSQVQPENLAAPRPMNFVQGTDTHVERFQQLVNVRLDAYDQVIEEPQIQQQDRDAQYQDVLTGILEQGQVINTEPEHPPQNSQVQPENLLSLRPINFSQATDTHVERFQQRIQTIQEQHIQQQDREPEYQQFLAGIRQQIQVIDAEREQMRQRHQTERDAIEQEHKNWLQQQEKNS